MVAMEGINHEVGRVGVPAHHRAIRVTQSVGEYAHYTTGTNLRSLEPFPTPVMSQGKVDAVIVGTDRVAANGDVANKIGTHGVAILAIHFGVPFYVAAPISSIDWKIADGSQIPIVERDPVEISRGFGRQTAPDGGHLYNPAFDVTPAALVTALITERGVVRPPYGENLAALRSQPN